MAKTGATIIDEVREAVGRTDDSEVITEDRVLIWVNEGQRKIAKQCPGLKALEVKNTTSMDTTQTLSYKLSDFTSPLAGASDATTANQFVHPMALWYVDGADSFKINYMPVDEFDSNYIDPTDSDFGYYQPKHWTRRGNNIEIAPLCATGYCNKTLRLDGFVYPRDFTGVSTTSASSLEDADDGIELYAVYKAWERIGGEEGKVEAVKNKTLFLAWIDEYRQENQVMHAWDANLYGDYE